MNGVYEASLGQASIKKKVMEQSKKSILLVDHSKFDSAHFYKINNFGAYHSVITDQKPSLSYEEVISNQSDEFIWHNYKK